MALDGTLLAAGIKTKLETKLPDYASVIGDNLDDFVAAIAEATVEHIIAAGLVTVTVTSVSGVTAGAGVSGPGTGTGTIS